MCFTATQEAVMHWAFDSQAEPIALLGGDVRSGKSYMVAAAMLALSLPREDEYAIIAGQSLGSLERALVDEIRAQAPQFGLEVHWHHRRASYSIGRNWFTPVGAAQADISAVVMGMSAFFAGSDELTLLDEGAVTNAMTRLDRDGARFMGAFNSSSSHSWVKRNWIDGDLPHELFVFGADAARDAGFLSQEAYDRYDKTLQGHRRAWYFGVADTGDLVWADPAGLVYPSLKERDAQGGPYSAVECGIDFGLGDSATSAVFFGRCPDGSWETVHEYYEQVEGRTAATHAREIVAIGERLSCSLYVLDPSALPMRNELLGLGVDVRRGKNDHDVGLDLFEEVLGDGRVRITSAAPMMLEEGAGYIWNEKRPGHPVRGFDHALDGGRYWVAYRFAPSMAYAGRKPRGL